MLLDDEICERARLARDKRFDGRFYTGVVTTGVYCRPVCPARQPQARNVRYFPSAAAASAAGFRPCLRCRPEASPGTPAWLGTETTVSRALRLIAAGALDDGDVGALAERLGIGARHLARLFNRHLGAPPRAVAQTRRLLFAKKLIDETGMAMAAVACAAGFGSVRRFNAVFRACYGRAPGDLRRTARRRDPSDGIRLRLAFRPPYDWPSLIAFLALRAIPGVERVTPDCYARTIALDGARGAIEVRPVAGAAQLELRVACSEPGALIRVVERVRRIFDLGADPAEIAGHLGRDAALAPLVAARPGLRLPGAWHGFELAVRAILGQQVTVKGASTLAGRLVAAFGEAIEGAGDGLSHLFPTVEALATADVAAIGMPKARAFDGAAGARDPGPGAGGPRRPRRLRRRARARPADKRADRARRYRRLDRALHRDARGRRARRLPGDRSGAAARRGAARHRRRCQGIVGPCRGLAAVARLCRDASVAQRSGRAGRAARRGAVQRRESRCTTRIWLARSAACC